MMLRIGIATLAVLFTTQAFAFTGHTCENEDRSKNIHVVYDGADNFFILGKLQNAEGIINGTLASQNRFRPTLISPDVPVQIIAFGEMKFSISLDSLSATLTSGNGITESLICCSLPTTCPR